MTIKPETLIEAEDRLLQTVDGHLASQISNKTSRGFNWASDLGFPCDTYQALCRLKGELRPKNPLGLEKVFRRGKVWETPNIRLLQDAGIQLIEKIGVYHWKEFQIKGRVDARVQLTLNGDKIICPFEHKTCSPNVFRTIKKHKEKGEPLTKAKYVWLIKYPGQIQTYMLQESQEVGLWFFFNVVNGDYFFWLYPLDYDYAETLIQRAELCNKNVASGIIPEPVQKEICLGCDFCETYCFVGKDFGAGFELVDEEDLISKLDRYHELIPVEDELKELRKELFGDKKKPGILYGRNIVTTDYKLSWKEIESSYWKIKEPKEQHAEKKFYTYLKPAMEKLREGGDE